MSATDTLGLKLRIQRSLRAFDASLDRLDAAAARELRLGRSDIRAMELVERAGRLPSTTIARQLGLTSGALTTLIDRLERRGFVRRAADPEDRRRVIIHMTADGARRRRELYGRFTMESAKSLARRSLKELEAIDAFLGDARTLADAARARIEKGG